MGMNLLKKCFVKENRRLWLLLTSILVIYCPWIDARNDEQLARKFSELALACVHQEYPNKISHVMSGDSDALPPRKLTPAFFGCFDWHSAVHGHWLLARVAKGYPDKTFSASAINALRQSLSQDNIANEVLYFEGAGRRSFERPYGLAWLLQLATELEEWEDPLGQELYENLTPLVSNVKKQLSDWLKKLAYPIRSGEHSQTAFAFSLILDWAIQTEDKEMMHLITRKSLNFYLTDRDCPLEYEPSGQDFLSPCLGEADLMRRILNQDEYSDWLRIFLPNIRPNTTSNWLPLAKITDREDGKLAHLDGLHLSRAWMLEGIISGLPDNDKRSITLAITADKHSEAGLSSVTGEHYSGGHWLGSFAIYLVTKRGLIRGGK